MPSTFSLSVADASIRAVCDGRRIMVAFVPAHVERTFTLTGIAEAIERLDLYTNDASAGSRLRLAKSDNRA